MIAILLAGRDQRRVREELRRGLQKTVDPQKVTQTALKRLDEQLARVNEMYEVGAIDRETYFAKRGRD